VRRRLQPLAEREGKSVEEYEKEQTEALRSGKRKAESAAWLHWKVTLWRWWRWVLRRKDPEPVDVGGIFDLLMSIHGQQVLQDGCFNADPHPGNILLLEDGKTLGLIDFGQVAYISQDFRLRLARLMLALANRDKALVARYESEIGVTRKYYKTDVQYRLCSFWLDRDDEDVTQGLNIFDLLVWGESQDPVLSLPDGYYLTCRCSTTLRSSALAFGVYVSTAEYWRPYAEEVLRQHGEL